MRVSAATRFELINSDKEWKCHPDVTPQCCASPDVRDVLGVTHGVIARSCVRCPVSWNGAMPLRKQNRSDIKSMQHIYTEYEQLDDHCLHWLKLKKNGEARALKSAAYIILDSFSLITTGNMLPKLNLINVFWTTVVYSVLILEQLDLFIFKSSKALKECNVTYFAWETRACSGSKCEGNKRKPNKLQLLNGCDDLLGSFERDFSMIEIHIAFLVSQETGFLNQFFTSTSIKKMLEGKNYWVVDKVFPFLFTILARFLGYSGNPFLISVQKLY